MAKKNQTIDYKKEDQETVLAPGVKWTKHSVNDLTQADFNEIMSAVEKKKNVPLINADLFRDELRVTKKPTKRAKKSGI